MELLHTWAQDFVAMPSRRRVEEILNNAGLPVDAIHSGADVPEGVVVGCVCEVAPHPNADRLKLTTVDVGTGEPLRIVCGAPNVKQGQKVATALVGTKLPNGMVIETVKIRGVESQGMLCAEDELGVGNDHNGILELPVDAEVGKPAALYVKGRGIVYTVAVMPNRPDCLSVIGLAREIAAAEGKKLPHVRLRTQRSSRQKTAAGRRQRTVRVKVLDKSACPLFCMQHLKNVTVRPSPRWMQERLRAAGVRPINNIVDITNYVLIELGRPLHAFDAQKLAGKDITVRRARTGERLTTLDGVTRKLTRDMVVVADAKGPVALGGVMGGEATAVTNETTEVLLEAAVFDKQLIYDTAHKLKLMSESAQRFSKGVDREMTLVGLRRAVELFMELGGAEPVGEPVVQGETAERRRSVSVRVSRTNALLGTELTRAEMEKLLTSIALDVKGRGDVMTVVPPSWRHDITIEEDVIEEVGRLHGFSRIARTIPKAPGRPAGLPKVTALTRALRSELVKLRFHEHVGYAYVPEEFVAGDLRTAVNITNPLSTEQSYLRTSLLPGLCALAEKNAKRFDHFRVFEFGKEYSYRGDFVETEVFALLCVEKQAFRALKGTLQALWRAIGLADRLTFGAPVEQRQKIFAGKKALGALLVPSPADRSRFKLPNDIALAHVSIDALIKISGELGRRRFSPIPQFPPVKRDLAFWVPAEHAYADIERHLLQRHELLTSVELFDVFTKDGRKSYAFHLEFSHPERTLEAKEIEGIYRSLTASLKKKFHAEIR